ncbi:hypothetical protein HDU92_003317, partial [Lobulomyces angularis]
IEQSQRLALKFKALSLFFVSNNGNEGIEMLKSRLFNLGKEEKFDYTMSDLNFTLEDLDKKNEMEKKEKLNLLQMQLQLENEEKLRISIEERRSFEERRREIQKDFDKISLNTTLTQLTADEVNEIDKDNISSENIEDNSKKSFLEETDISPISTKTVEIDASVKSNVNLNETGNQPISTENIEMDILTKSNTDHKETEGNIIVDSNISKISNTSELLNNEKKKEESEKKLSSETLTTISNLAPSPSMSKSSLSCSSSIDGKKKKNSRISFALQDDVVFVPTNKKILKKNSITSHSQTSHSQTSHTTKVFVPRLSKEFTEKLMENEPGKCCVIL